MRVRTDKNKENEKTSSKGPSTKYDHFMKVSMDKKEENEKNNRLKILIITHIEHV